MNKPHKHAELIKAWADGAEIEWLDTDGYWVPTRYPFFHDSDKYRIVPPKKLCTMTDENLCNVFNSVPGLELSLRAVAEAAIQQYIEDQINKD